MKLSAYKKYTCMLLTVLVFSCTGEFEEVNTNPNNPLTSQPNLLLPGIERDMMKALLDETWGIGNIVIQHTAKNQFVNEDRYLWGERNAIWDAVYSNMRDINNILLLAEQNKLPNYRGIALVLKSWMFSLVTDAYGDVPYKETMKGKVGIFFPTYDKQEDIYAGILADLAEANTLLASATNVTGDLIYGGNVKKWQMLANSLRLRYLMRVSDRQAVGEQMNAILNDSENNPVFTSVSDNAVYGYKENAPDQFPLFTSRIGSFNEFRASKTLTDKLLSLNDPRLKIFFRPTPQTEGTSDPADDQYVGIPNGLDDVDALTYNKGPEFQSRISSFFYEESNTKKGMQVAKGVIMTYAELQFILAEARERNIINVGTAQTYYTNGITASFDYYGESAPASYFTQADVTYTGTMEQKLAKIGTQKWISLYYQGLEAWFDWKRTGYPVLAPGVDNQNNDKIPVRFIYPLIEQSLNSASRNAAVSRQGADDINTRVWWDVK